MEKGGHRVGEEEIVPVGVFDGVDDLDIRHFNLKFHHRDRGERREFISTADARRLTQTGKKLIC
jgi:hypothetical protein